MRKGIALLLVLVLLLASCEIIRSTAGADSKSIIVPDDYLTIAAAVGNATDGDTILVRKGIYEGPENQTLLINKTISIIGENASETILNMHPPLITIMTLPDWFMSHYAYPILITASNVTLSGFTVTSDGGDIAAAGEENLLVNNIFKTSLQVNGICQTVANNTIEERIDVGGSYCVIYANKIMNAICTALGPYNSIYANIVIGGGLGIRSINPPPHCGNLIYNNTVKNGEGIWADYGDIVANNTVIGSDKGISVPVGYNNIIYGNVVINNHGPGLSKDVGLNNIFYANHVVNNSIGVLLGTKGDFYSKTTFYHNNFINNMEQTQIVNIDHSDNWDNGKEGNYWSNYTGSDINHDGIGDTPYVMTGDSYHENYPRVTYGDSYEDRYPLIAPFDIETVQTQLPEWAANVSNVNPEVPKWPLQEPGAETFPVTIVVTGSSLSITVFGAALIVYFKKHKR